jgi:hypothetical protein
MTPLETIASHFTHEKRAIQWLNQICTGNEWVSIESRYKDEIDVDVVNFNIELQGESLRKYRIVGAVTRGEKSLVSLMPEQVLGTDEQADEQDGMDAWCSLCLNPIGRNSELPLGDRLCSLLLALHNDIQLAKSIAIIDLFLAHDHNDHKWIIGYHSEGMYLPGEDKELYELVPEEIRHLNHHFYCIEDDLQFASLNEEDAQLIFDEEIHIASNKIRKKKQFGE